MQFTTLVNLKYNPRLDRSYNDVKGQ